MICQDLHDLAHCVNLWRMICVDMYMKRHCVPQEITQCNRYKYTYYAFHTINPLFFNLQLGFQTLECFEQCFLLHVVVALTDALYVFISGAPLQQLRGQPVGCLNLGGEFVRNLIQNLLASFVQTFGRGKWGCSATDCGLSAAARRTG